MKLRYERDKLSKTYQILVQQVQFLGMRLRQTGGFDRELLGMRRYLSTESVPETRLWMRISVMLVGTPCVCSPLTPDPSPALGRGEPITVCSQSARPKVLIHLSAQTHDDFRKRFDVLERSAKIHDAEA